LLDDLAGRGDQGVGATGAEPEDGPELGGGV
jgi:hypothetical protein